MQWLRMIPSEEARKSHRSIRRYFTSLGEPIELSETDPDREDHDLDDEDQDEDEEDEEEEDEEEEEEEEEGENDQVMQEGGEEVVNHA